MIISKMCEEYIDILKYLSDKYENFSYSTNRKELINTEMFFIFLYITKIKPEVIFESGFWNGRSSLIILEILKRFNIKCDYYIACIIKKPQIYFEGDYDNFNLMMGEGEEIVKKVSKINHDMNMISLIDGPKFKYYSKCEKIYDVLFNNFNVQAVFQHDIHRSKDMINYEKYYNEKIIKNRYGLYKIGDTFLNNCFNVLEKEKVKEQKLGLICDKDLFIKDISI